MPRLFLVFVIILLCAAAAGSQTPDYSIEYLTIDEGLPQNEVTSIIQDKKGFMWFGTRGGLARYDGYNMKVFQVEPGNPNSLSSNTIESLFESSDGKIWIGMEGGGLNCFDPFQETFTQYPLDSGNQKSGDEDIVYSITETPDGTIWVATNGKGLNGLDRSNGKFHRLLDGYFILDVTCSSDGTLWVAHSNQLFKIERESVDPVKIDLGLPGHVGLRSIIPDEENGLLFLSGWEMGLVIYDVRNEKVIKQIVDPVRSTESKSSNNLYSLYRDKNSKKLWMGFWGDGLKCLGEDQNIEKIFIAPDLQEKYNTDYDIVLDIFGDRSGNVWIGTDGGGVCKLSMQKSFFKSFTFKNSDLSSGHILSMMEDRKGRLWIGTKGGGLNQLQGDRIIHHKEVYDQVGDVKINDIHTIYEDVDGDLWFGSNFGLHKITKILNNRIHFKTFRPDHSRPNSLSNEKVTAILRDNRGRFWVGTQELGLNRLIEYDKDGSPAFRTYGIDPKNPFSLASNRITTLFEDSKGRLWIGTFKGLHLYKDDIDGFIKLCQKTDGGLSNEIVTCIKEDNKGRIWVGTPSGLNKITVDNNILKARYFTKKDGLPNDYINSILVDSLDNLWIGSNGGITRLNVERHKIQLFNVSDGLQSNAFSGNAACLGASGLMYFGGTNGFSVFDPSETTQSASSPLYFSSLKIMNQEMQPGSEVNGERIIDRAIPYVKEITLTHLARIVTFEVSSIDFTSQSKNQYAFKLEGFDSEWTDFKSVRTVTYTNLKAGHYTLLARAGANGNEWVGDPIAIKITVLPPYWETWWFRSLIAAVVLGGIVTFFRIRINRVKKQKFKLERLVEERTEEIMEQKIVLENQSKDLRATTEELQATNEELQATTEELKATNEELQAQTTNLQLLNEKLETQKDAITVQREVAEKARTEAERATKAKSIFLATMSHEIRTPMNGVLGMASLLAETSLTSEQQEYTETIVGSGEALLTVINDILDFSKIESGNLELDCHSFDLPNCIENVLDLFSKKAVQKGLDLVYEIDQKIPTQLVTDSHRLRQVLINLVGNSLKFTSHGEIFVKVDLMPADSGQLELAFHIRDTGIGIPKHKMATLFKAFSQVDSSTTRKYGGTGLGLVISQRLVELMGGSISVDSEDGKGTTFSFTIKATTDQEALQYNVNDDAVELQSKKVLLVDDNETSLTTLANLLKVWKMLPEKANSAQEALRLIEQNKPFDLVITDMHMQEMDGIQLSVEFKRKYKDIPVILLGSVGDECKKKYADVFAFVLNKPVRQLHLRRSVQQALFAGMPLPTEVAKPIQILSTGFAIQHPLNILLAEDNPVNQKLAIRTLNKLGYTQIVIAENGAEALKKYHESHYDLILMDVQMPVMDGLEATRQIRLNARIQPVIIAMTANAMKDDEEACFQAGMNYYVAKPFKLNDLISALEKASNSVRKSLKTANS